MVAPAPTWPGYRHRAPETEPLYQVVADHLQTFLARTRSSDRQLPAYVEQELRAGHILVDRHGLHAQQHL